MNNAVLAQPRLTQRRSGLITPIENTVEIIPARPGENRDAFKLVPATDLHLQAFDHRPPHAGICLQTRTRRVQRFADGIVLSNAILGASSEICVSRHGADLGYLAFSCGKGLDLGATPFWTSQQEGGAELDAVLAGAASRACLFVQFPSGMRATIEVMSFPWRDGIAVHRGWHADESLVWGFGCDNQVPFSGKALKLDRADPRTRQTFARHNRHGLRFEDSHDYADPDGLCIRMNVAISLPDRNNPLYA